MSEIKKKLLEFSVVVFTEFIFYDSSDFLAAMVK